jgi:hypothetical protein
VLLEDFPLGFSLKWPYAAEPFVYDDGEGVLIAGRARFAANLFGGDCSLWATAEMPKSLSRIWLSRPISMFSGLTSRWIKRLLWA